MSSRIVLAKSMWAWLAAVGSALTALTWVVASLLMANRGFDVTDEAYYILCYRWWSTNLQTFTGVQYVYGPVFQALGYQIPLLRIVRMVTVVAAHAAFAWGFMTWLAPRLPEHRATRPWLWAGGLAIVASGGVIYGWLPLSPGYNDVSILTTLGIAASVLRIARACELSGRIPVRPAVALSVLTVILALGKSIAALPSLTILGAAAIAVAVLLRARGWLVFAATYVAGVVVLLAGVNYLVMPFSRMLPPLRAVSSLVARRTNSPTQLLDLYWTTTEALLRQSLVLLRPTAVMILVGLVLLRLRWRRAGVGALVIASPLSLVIAFPHVLPGGGVAALPLYAKALVGAALTVAAAFVVDVILRRRARRRAGSAEPAPTAEGEPAVGPGRRTAATWTLVTMVLVLPTVQALGTGNWLYFMAVNQFACWVALMVAAVFLISGPGVRALAASATACAILVAASTGADALLLHPYRTDPYVAAVHPIGGDSLLAALQVSSGTKARYDHLMSEVPHTVDGRPVMVFDGMPGLALLFRGSSVGEAWYSSRDHGRSSIGIRSYCGQRTQPWAHGEPLIVFNRHPVRSDLVALKACGLNLTQGYHIVTGVAPAPGRPRLTIYLPPPAGTGSTG